MTAIALPARTRAHRAALLTAGLLWSLGILITNIQPVVFEALHQSRSLSDSQLGSIGAAYVLGGALASGASPFWMPRLNPRWVSAGALVATALGLLGVAIWAKSDSLMIWWFAVGLANGFVATPAFAALGDTEDPVKTYSLALFAASVIAALASFGLPLFALPLFGGKGVLIAIGALFALATPAALAQFDAQHRAYPDAPGVLGTSAERSKSRGTIWKAGGPLLAAVTGSVFTGVLMGAIYNFIGSIIVSQGLAFQTLGPIVALGLVGSLAGSILPSILGDRVRPDVAISLAGVAMVLSYPSMMSHSIILLGGGFIMRSRKRLAIPIISVWCGDSTSQIVSISLTPRSRRSESPRQRPLPALCSQTLRRRSSSATRHA